MRKKTTSLLAALAGATIVVMVVCGEVDSVSDDHEARAVDRPQVSKGGGDVIVTITSPEVAADEEQVRFAHVAEKEEQAHPLAAAQAELETHINDSLEGAFQVNSILDQLLEYARLPVSEVVDFDYEDDDSVAYRILGLPDGTAAHFLVGSKAIERGGSDYQQFQFEVQMSAGHGPDFYRGAWREGPRVHIALDQDENGNPTVLSMLTERRVALNDSRHRGVDAYQGRFTSGASFWVDISDPQAYRAETFGIVNGHYASAGDFGAVHLAGDLVIDPQRVSALSRLLQQHYRSVREQEK